MLTAIRTTCRPNNFSLYLVTHRPSVPNDAAFMFKIVRAVQAGVTAIQLRDSSHDLDALERTALWIKPILASYGVCLIINNYVHIARRVGADGVHIGPSDTSVKEARDLLGPDAIIGRTVNTFEDAIAAAQQNITYLSPVLFPSLRTKPEHPSEHLFGLERLHHLRTSVSTRLVPIGGITLRNLHAVKRALHIDPLGDGVAMVGDLWRADDPAQIASRIREILEEKC